MKGKATQAKRFIIGALVVVVVVVVGVVVVKGVPNGGILSVMRTQVSSLTQFQ